MSFSLSTAGREDLDGNHKRRDQIGKRYANPHQRAGTFLILQRRQTEDASRRYIAGVNNAATECEKRGKNVTGQGGKKKVQGHGPLGAVGITPPRLDDRAPEHERREETGCGL